ncbi:glycoside hydrolase family 18 protein [Xenorhabdus bovienii]|uniref:glycoside hydrolase family 18 protein n=1 Tax=Xenorhabdus bovienii TaxID=40576 RepID=UPI0023B250D6|nr:glycoside hydrolase family 18 protein [Xenorhabdus bovienii]MDE9452298.1 glycoside hydrolase family 18 protein [Xenorhabdus bovienii]MDE9541418.1 glycoside hydrolase family 18 protein [Xenorhabdus bovienii]
MSKLTQLDPLSEESYRLDHFIPATETTKFSYTSGRVALPVYNKYNVKNKPKVIGYYTDWSQYDSRLQGNQTPSARGRGIDLQHLLDNPFAYDKLIIGFCGIVGDQGEKKALISQAAPKFGRYNNGEVTFTDEWGDCQSYVNCTFPRWQDVQMPRDFNQDKSMGVLGGLAKIQDAARAQGHELVMSFSVGGWTMSNGFYNMVRDSQLKSKFISSLIDIFKRFPMFTEVDIDWEYPGAKGNDNPHDPKDGEYYISLIRDLSSAFKNAGRSDIKISIACSAVPDIMEKSKIPELLKVGLYGINVMTYDFFGTPWADKLRHHTNLRRYPGSENSVEKAVEYLLSVGVPSQAINIGYAGYSRNGKNTNITSYSPLSGSYSPGTGTTTGTFESGSTEWYDTIYNYLNLESRQDRHGFTLYTDEIADADYLYNQNSKLFISLDTPRTVKAKAKYALEKNLGGVFTWTADQDRGPLVNAAREGLGCPLLIKKIDMEPFYYKGKTNK